VDLNLVIEYNRVQEVAVVANRALVTGKTLCPRNFYPGLLLVGVFTTPATHLVVREPPKAKRTKRHLETVTWLRLELRYGNNRLDDVETLKWAIRMVTSYGRYCKPMEGRQRLNGCAALLMV
jgi:hypothetical protein